MKYIDVTKTDNKRPPGPTNYGQKCGNICLRHQNVKRNKSELSKKPKLDNARRLRGIYFIDPDDEEFKDIMKNARRMLEIPMPAAMPCKTSLCRSSRETCCTVGGHKTKYACTVEADESLRIRKEGAPHPQECVWEIRYRRITKTILQEKVRIH